MSDGMRELGLYELRVARSSVGAFLPGTVLSDVVGGKYRYAGLLPRLREGAKREDVVSVGNLLWLDVDSPDALQSLDVFRDAGLPVSLVMASGHGYWFFWKLTELIHIDVLEDWNRSLNMYARERIPDVDKGCWNRSRVARLAGTVHERTGVEAQFLSEVSTWDRFSTEEVKSWFDTIPSNQVSAPSSAGRKVQSEVGRGRSLVVVSFEGHRADVQEVASRFRWYLVDPPPVEEIYERGETRHGIEFALVCALIEDAHCSNDEIRALFDEWLPLKHAERLDAGGSNPYGYLDTTITNARKQTKPKRAGSRPKRSRSKRSYVQVDRSRGLADAG